MKEEKDIQPIDNLFRQSLEGYCPAPPPSVWKNIRLQLSEKKSGRGIWFSGPGGLTVISAVLLVSSFILYKSFFAENETSNQKSSVSYYRADSAKHQQTPSLKNHPSSDIQVNAAAKPVSDENNKPGFQSNDANKKPGQDKPVSENLTANWAVSSAQSSSYAKTQTSTKVPSVSDNIESSVTRKEDIPNINSNQNAEIKLPDKDFVFSDTGTIEAFIERSAGVIATALPKTSEDVISPFASQKTQNEPDTINIPATPGLTEPETKTNAIQAGIYGNIGQVYQKDRSPNLFYGGMITGGIWNKKWEAGIETGIGFSHYNDQGLYEFEFKQSDTIGYTVFTYLNSFDSSYLFVYKPNIVDTLIYFDTITQTSYSYLKIPLYFTKQFFRSGKFSAGIKTGPSVEFMIARTETQPEYLPEGMTLVKITNKSYTRLKTSWQWFIAPQLNWDITDKIRFSVEPAAVFFLSNPYESEYSPPSKPYLLSITGGLIFKFE